MIVAAAFWFGLMAVDVVGSGACPAVADVSRRLAELSPATEDAAREHHRAELSRSETGIHVELLNPAGERLAERDLAPDGSCDDLAGAVAVVIAAWEADLDPRITARVRLPPAPVRTAPPSVAVHTAQAPPRRPPSFDLGLDLIASLTGGQLAPGARVGGWIAPAGWRLGLSAGLSGVTARSEPVGSQAEAARWTRFAFAVGPEARFDVGRTLVAAHVQALAALLRVEGVGLPTTASDSAAQLGTSVGLRAGRTWGTATPWIGVDLLFWPGRDRLEIAGLAAQGELPRLDLQFAFGLSVGRFP